MGARFPHTRLSHDRLRRRCAADAAFTRRRHQAVAGDGAEIGATLQMARRDCLVLGAAPPSVRAGTSDLQLKFKDRRVWNANLCYNIDEIYAVRKESYFRLHFWQFLL